MKKIFLLTLLLTAFVSNCLLAQYTPKGFNYQTVVRNSDGTAVVNQSISIIFTIKAGAPNGPVTYAEKQTTTTNALGLINLVIGQGGTTLQGDFSAINWAGGAKFLNIAVETSPNVYEELGTTQFMSVPYAEYALNSGNGNQAGDNWGTQTIQTDVSLGGNGTTGSPLAIAGQNAQPGQVLKWDGVKWAPSDDVSNTGVNGGTVTLVNTGVGLTGGPVSVTGTISLKNTGVVPGSYGSASEIPVITVDAQGRITNVFTLIPSPGTIGMIPGDGINVVQNGYNFTVTNTGDTNQWDDITSISGAGGDISGTFANLQVNPNTISTTEVVNQSILGIDINQMDASLGNVLKWNGTSWSPSTDATGINSIALTQGNGISVTGNSPNFTVTNTGDVNADDDLLNTSAANGDVTGVFSNLQIKNNVVGSDEILNGSIGTDDLGTSAVTAVKMDDMGATTGQILKWNGTVWAPAADATGSSSIVAGTGIIVGNTGSTFTISNLGDIDATDDLTNTSTANGDVSGIFSNLQIKNNAVNTAEIANSAVTAAKLDDMGATNGQILKWNGTAWIPSADASGSSNVVAGAGINVTNTSSTFTVINLGDTDASDDLTNTSTANGDVSGVFSNLQIKNNAVSTAELANNAVTAAKLDNMGATNGQILKWNGNNWAPAADATGAGSDNWGTQFVVTEVTLDGTGTTANKLDIAQQGATTGQVLKWNGTRWAPAPDATGGTGGNTDTYIQGAGISVTGTSPTFTISNVGDLSNTNELQNMTLVGNTLTLSQGGGVITLPNSGGSGNTYAQGTGINVTGTAPNFVINNAGDLSATNELQNITLTGNTLTLSQGGGSVTLPNSGGSGNTYTQGTGITVTGTAPNFVINNAGDVSNTNELQTLSLTGNNITLSQGGGTIALPSSGSNFWTATGNNIKNSNIGNVIAKKLSVATDSSYAPLTVQGDGVAAVLTGDQPQLSLVNAGGNLIGSAPTGFLKMEKKYLTLGTNRDSTSIHLTPGTTVALTATALGSIGIGTDAPGNYRLNLHHQDYGLLMQNTMNNRNWEFWVSETQGNLMLFNNNGLPTAAPVGQFALNGVYTGSDKRLKKDIRNVPNILDKILKINPVYYRYNQEKDDAKQSIGVIAQDLEAQFPELVGIMDGHKGQTDYLSVNYAGLGVLAIKGIQEQQAQIKALNAENAALKSKLESLESRLSKLEKK
jgi:hypothetical protein